MIHFTYLLDLLRNLRATAQAVGNGSISQGLLDLQGQLLHLQVRVLEQQVQLRLVQDEAARLRGCLTTARRLQRVNEAYFVVKSETDVQGPYCVTCWDRREVLQELVEAGAGAGYCPNCKVRTGLREAEWPNSRKAATA
ncbi:MAG: hypothetical protein ABI120_13020 [Gemmatimonadaceae bacterium]